MPPSAFQNRNVGHAILFMPASHAEAIRRPATQRPRNTALGPCLAKNGSPCSSTFARWRWQRAADEEQPPAVAAADREADVVAEDRGRRREHGQRDDVHLALVREQRGGDQRRLGGHRDAHRLDRDQREDGGVADVRRDVDQRGEHRTSVYRAAAMAIGILTGSGTYALPGFEGSGPEPVATPWGEALVSRGTWAGVDVLHISRHGAGHPRLSNHVTHRANIAALQALGATRGAGGDGLRRGRPVGGARVARVLRRPALPRQPPAGRRACARSSRSRVRASAATGSTRARSRRRCARRCSTGAADAGVAVRDGGCYGHVDGPRFNTRAEIRGLAACGVTAVSQTAGPETVLCGEAELPYALLGFLDRLRQRRHRRGDAGRDADRDDGRLDRGVRARSCAPRCRARRPRRPRRRASSTASMSE